MATAVMFTNPVLLDYFQKHPEAVASDIADEALRSYSKAAKPCRKASGRPRKTRNLIYVKLSNDNAKWLSSHRKRTGVMQRVTAERIVMKFLGLEDPTLKEEA